MEGCFFSLLFLLIIVLFGRDIVTSCLWLRMAKEGIEILGNESHGLTKAFLKSKIFSNKAFIFPFFFYLARCKAKHQGLFDFQLSV